MVVMPLKQLHSKCSCVEVPQINTVISENEQPNNTLSDFLFKNLWWQHGVGRGRLGGDANLLLPPPRPTPVRNAKNATLLVNK